ncbi:MAG: hypothetical protein AAGM84_01435 [Pseudomonadota bacterium]
MTDDRNDALIQIATGDLASRVISVLRHRQTATADGARRFVLDHLLRAIGSKGEFDPGATLEVLRGHRVPLDRIIDLYIPHAAHALGEMWTEDEIDFATVTVGVMRLQSLLGEASSEVFLQPNASHVYRALIVVPQNEQHFLGALVAAAQMRRLGCETEVSFAEEQAALIQRARYDHTDMILFTCARASGLEPIGQSVLGIRNALTSPPVMAVGGALRVPADVVQETTGADLVTTDVKDVIAFCAQRRKAMTAE